MHSAGRRLVQRVLHGAGERRPDRAARREGECAARHRRPGAPAPQPTLPLLTAATGASLRSVLPRLRTYGRGPPSLPPHRLVHALLPPTRSAITCARTTRCSTGLMTGARRRDRSGGGAHSDHRLGAPTWGSHTGATHRPRKTRHREGWQPQPTPPAHLFLSASPPVLSASPPVLSAPPPPLPTCLPRGPATRGGQSRRRLHSRRPPPHPRTCTCTCLPARLSHARTSAAGGAFACSLPSALPARSFDSAGSLLSGTMARRGTLDAEYLAISRHISPYLESHGLARHPYPPYLHTAGWASSRPRRTRGTCCTSRSSWSP